MGEQERHVRRVVYAVVTLVAAFAFLVSYNHIYDLAGKHGQNGAAQQLLPLSVDLLIVAASLVLYLQSRADARPAGMARFLPRLMLWAGIGATVAANLAYGVPSGWLSAVISAWPGAVFAGLVEMVMVAVRPVAREPVNRTLILPAQPVVPASAYEAAQAAYAASVAGGNPIGEYRLAARFGIPRSQARKICIAVGASTNGSGPDE